MAARRNISRERAKRRTRFAGYQRDNSFRRMRTKGEVDEYERGCITRTLGGESALEA